jgi:hypothetical protein
VQNYYGNQVGESNDINRIFDSVKSTVYGVRDVVTDITMPNDSRRNYTQPNASYDDTSYFGRSNYTGSSGYSYDNEIPESPGEGYPGIWNQYYGMSGGIK